MAAYEYTALDARRPGTARSPGRRQRPPGAPAAARPVAAAGDGHRGQRRRADAGFQLLLRQPDSGCGPRAPHPPVVDAGAVRHPARRSAARGFAAEREGPRAQRRRRRSRARHGRTDAGRGTRGAFRPYSRRSIARRFPRASSPGHLDTVLERMADYTENRQMLQQKIRNAMIYPVLLTIVCLGIVGLLLGYVVPEVVRVFEAGDRELPILTRMLIAASDFLRAWWWLMLIVDRGRRAGASAAGCATRLRGYRYDAFKLRLPLIGRITRGNNAARFARTFSILTASAVPVLEALQDRRRTSSPIRPCAVRCRTPRCGCARARRSPAPWAQASCSRRCSSTSSRAARRAASSKPCSSGPPTTRNASSTAWSIRQSASWDPVMILLMGGFVFVIVDRASAADLPAEPAGALRPLAAGARRAL